MAIVQAYQCPRTGKLFSLDNKGKYQKHLKKQARIRLANRKISKAKNDLGSTKEKLAEVKDFDELHQFVYDNWEFFYINGFAHDTFRQHDPAVIRIPKLMELEFNIRVWSPTTSNTHYCPHNGVTNWHQESDKPTGYPGWSGIIWISYSLFNLKGRERTISGSNLFRELPIHTGSGGSRAHSQPLEENESRDTFSYELKIFEADFPAMAENLKQAKLEAKLRGDREPIVP